MDDGLLRPSPGFLSVAVGPDDVHRAQDERRLTAKTEFFHKVPKWEWRLTDRFVFEI